jgi:hypothetical protein
VLAAAPLFAPAAGARRGGQRWEHPRMPDTSQNEPVCAEESSLEVWPPSGFRAYYTVSERIVDEPEVSYDLVLPGNFAEVDLATVRIGRHGGASDADIRFGAELYERIGAVAVAAGRVEMAMKRLLLVLTAPQKAHFSTVDHMDDARQEAPRAMRCIRQPSKAVGRGPRLE